MLGRSARRAIDALDWAYGDAVENALGLLAADPYAGEPLRGRLRGLWALRIGSYRIPYQLCDGDRTVRVLAVRHRLIAYRSDPRG